MNDQVPRITNQEFEGGVEFPETVEAGFSVLTVTAEDGDEDGTPNAEIRFDLGDGPVSGIAI